MYSERGDKVELLPERVEQDLQSEDGDDLAYAMRACCIRKISNEKIIQRLKELKTSDKIGMYQKISRIAIATLDILGIEKYCGDDEVIKDIIETVYYSKE